MPQRYLELLQQGKSCLIAAGPGMGQSLLIEQLERTLKAQYGHGSDVDCVPVVVEVKQFTINHRRAIDRLAKVTFDGVLDPHVQRHLHPPMAPVLLYKRGLSFAQVYLNAAEELWQQLRGTGGFCRYLWLWDTTAEPLQAEQWQWCLAMIALTAAQQAHTPYANGIWLDPWQSDVLMQQLAQLGCGSHFEQIYLEPWSLSSLQTYCHEQLPWRTRQDFQVAAHWPILEDYTGGHPGLLLLALEQWAQEPEQPVEQVLQAEQTTLQVHAWLQNLQHYLQQKAPAGGYRLLRLRRWLVAQGQWQSEATLRQAYPHWSRKAELYQLLALGLVQRQIASNGDWHWRAVGQWLASLT